MFGRRADLAVDVSNFAGGDLTFRLYKSASASVPNIFKVLFKRTKPVPLVGATPVTVRFPVVLSYPWDNLNASGALDIVRSSWRTGEDIHYPVDVDEVQEAVTEDLTSPPFHFTVSAKDETPVTSGTIRRDYPKFTEGNSIQLFMDGDKALPAILQAIAAAQHHIHLDWFFFAPDDIGRQVIAVLIARAQAGVKVRLLFDHFKTGAVPPSLAGMGVGRKPLQEACPLSG